MTPARAGLIPAQAEAAEREAANAPRSAFVRIGSRAAILLIAPAVMAVLAAWGLTRHGDYGGDEAATRWAALLPMHDLLHLLSHVDAVHGLYYLGMHAWVVFGRGPIALRMPSVIAAVAAAGVVTELGRRLSGRAAVGVVAGLLYATSPFVTFYAQTARSYAIVSLVVASSTLALVRALEAEAIASPRRVLIRRWIAYGVLISLGGWLNEMALLVVAAHAITVGVRGYAPRAGLRWIATAVAGMASVLPLFFISSREQDAVEWIKRPSGHDIVTLFRDYFGPHPAVMVITIGCAVVAAWPRQRTTRVQVSVTSVALPLLVLPPLVLIVESEVARPLYVDRYLLYSVIGAVLLVAEGARRIGHSVFRPHTGTWLWVPGIAVLLFTFVVQIPTAQMIRTPDSRLRNFGATARFINSNSLPGDGVLFISSFFRLAELGYPHDFRNLRDVALEESPRASGTFRGIELPFDSAAPRILSRDRIWLIGHGPYGPLPSTLYDEERDLVVRHYQLQRYVQFQGTTVTLWVRRPLPTRLGPGLGTGPLAQPVPAEIVRRVWT